MWRGARISLLVLPLLAGCSAIASLSNPLIGKWTAAEGGFTLGTYEFGPNSVSAFGIEQPVTYAVAGDTIRVIPQGFGPEFVVKMLDHDTARVSTAFTGDLITLHRTP
jgi:hypothetical protein